MAIGGTPQVRGSLGPKAMATAVGRACTKFDSRERSIFMLSLAQVDPSGDFSDFMRKYQLMITSSPAISI